MGNRDRRNISLDSTHKADDTEYSQSIYNLNSKVHKATNRSQTSQSFNGEANDYETEKVNDQ